MRLTKMTGTAIILILGAVLLLSLELISNVQANGRQQIKCKLPDIEEVNQLRVLLTELKDTQEEDHNILKLIEKINDKATIICYKVETGCQLDKKSPKEPTQLHQ
jgi:hypothetical protein|tara:strand:- start:12467 stop:12781 length:315 start_codon:yes stop_codon:yes gene_type:complete